MGGERWEVEVRERERERERVDITGESCSKVCSQISLAG